MIFWILEFWQTVYQNLSFGSMWGFFNKWIWNIVWNVPCSQKGGLAVVQKENYKNIKAKLQILLRTVFQRFFSSVVVFPVVPALWKKEKHKKSLLLLLCNTFLFISHQNIILCVTEWLHYWICFDLVFCIDVRLVWPFWTRHSV